jgi:hypothetical protein
MGCMADAGTRAPDDAAPPGRASQALNAAPSHWRSSRGPGDGTAAIPGTGQLTGQIGGYPARVWSYLHTPRGFQQGESIVGDFDGDSRPEIIGLSQGRAYLWDEDGSVLATSASIPAASIHGLYDLDGDGDQELLIAAGNRIGMGLVVLDPKTLAIQWTSDDPGFNSGVNVNETAVVDLDGDTIPEIVWDPAFYGITRAFSVASFAKGMASPHVLATSLPSGYRNLIMPVAGNYFGTAQSPKVTLASHQNTLLSFISPAKPGDAGATCSGSLCLRMDGQFPQVTDSYTFGNWISFDANGDGDDEFLTTSLINSHSAEILAVDPSAGLVQGVPNTGAAVMWQYRYGVDTQYQTHTTAQAVRGAVSSTGERIVPVSINNAGTDEKNRAGVPTSDCLQNPGHWGVVVFDARKGTPLATLPNARVWGSMDSDHDGLTEIVIQKEGGPVVGYELSCTGATHAAGWQSCASTGCNLVQQWSVPGSLFLHKSQSRSPTDSYYVASSPAVVDLTGDGVPEVLVRAGGDIVAYRVDQPSGPKEIGRYAMGACNTLGRVTGNGPGTWLLLEGVNCLAVLDAGLHALTKFGVAQNYGSAATLTGHTSVPILALSGKLIINPLGAAQEQSIAPYAPVLFADLDHDGIDELVAVRNPAAGDWSVRVLRWQGASFQPAWTVSAADLSDTYALAALAAAGDFDGDGDLDVAVRSSKDKVGETLHLLDGAGNGSGGGKALAKHTMPPGGLTPKEMIAGDVCAQGTCPGSDGRDEVLFTKISSTALYDTFQGQSRLLNHITPYPFEQAVADFDGDGKNELGSTLSIGAAPYMHVEVREIDGTLRWARPLNSTTDRYTETAFADANGDHATDILRGGGYGEIEVYSGIDGAMLPGFPLYLSQGKASPAVGNKPVPIGHIAAADIDGDGHMEALVAHADGYLYAVNVDPAEGSPSIAWTVYFGAPLSNVRVADLDDDGALEVLVSPEDGRLYVVDKLNANVTIDEPLADGCLTASSIQVGGTATGVDQVVVYVNGTSVASLSGIDGNWSVPVDFPGEGEFVISVSGFLNDVEVTTTALTVTHWADNDGDGFSECEADCNDADATVYPGAPEVCDGLDDDCDGVVPPVETEDLDGDGVYGCLDLCPGTVPDSGNILPDRYRWLGGPRFTTNKGSGKQQSLVQSSFSIVDTGGCSCGQIASALGAGSGSLIEGCTPGLMTQWRAQAASR